MTRRGDKRFEDMLYAYELGMLSDEECEEFELYLLEDDDAFKKAHEFQEAARLLRHNPGFRELAARLVEESPPKTEPEIRPERIGRWKKWAAVVPTAAVAMTVLVLLILKPWDIEIRSTKEAIASENRLAIMYFKNIPDPSDSLKLGIIAANLLITDLSESDYVQVVSGQRLHDILRLMGRPDDIEIDRLTAMQIAVKADARWMLIGNILQVEPELIITSQLINVSTGDVTASQRVAGDSGETIFSMVDRLTQEIKADLSLPIDARQESDPSVADVTTHSSDAYRHYLDGIDYKQKFYNSEAASSFRKALEYDSTFAMAYYYLSCLPGISGSDELHAKAVKYSGHASRKERYYILSQKSIFDGDIAGAIDKLEEMIERYPDEKEGYFQIGVYKYYLSLYEEAGTYSRKAIEIDPLFKEAYNQLAYIYNKSGNFEQSIWAINKYISLAPDEANPYDSRGDIYAANGKLDKAIQSYMKALEIKPDYHTSLNSLGLMYVFNLNFDRADSCFQVLANVENRLNRAIGRFHLAFVPLYQGKYGRALQILDDGIAADRLEHGTEIYPSFRYLSAVIHHERNDLALALQEMNQSLEISKGDFSTDTLYGKALQIQLLAESGDFPGAERAARAMKKNLEDSDKSLSRYWCAMGAIELAREDPETAANYLKNATDDKTAFNFPAHVMLGHAFMKLDRFEDAIAIFNTLLSRYADKRIFWAPLTVKVHYYLGLAHEKLGQTGPAIEQYQTFLEIWKDADTGIKEIEDARKSMARLKSNI
ncbi:MAG: tetratricopeptide repeat protein [Candidatus Zixiibacteriota bacterium]|nr:MAG: tetratricopeptide repeat protein [candidate division Zixibacteria bacterium]